MTCDSGDWGRSRFAPDVILLSNFPPCPTCHRCETEVAMAMMVLDQIKAKKISGQSHATSRAGVITEMAARRLLARSNPPPELQVCQVNLDVSTYLEPSRIFEIAEACGRVGVLSHFSTWSLDASTPDIRDADHPSCPHDSACY